jgi:hypothetical protein
LAGGVPGQRVVVEGVKGVKYSPMPPRMYKNGEKMSGLPNFFAYKPLKTFFAQKYLTRYTPETFLRNTLILKYFSI